MSSLLAWPRSGSWASASTRSSAASKCGCRSGDPEGGRMRAIAHIVLFAALLAVPLAGSAHAQGTVPKVVRFGVQPSTQPPYIAREAGFFKEVEEKFNTKIEFVSFPFGGPQNNAFAAGELDFSQKGMAPCAVAMQRAKAKLLMINILEQTAIISLPEIKSVA